MTASIEELEHRTARLECAQNDNTETLRWVVTKLARIQAAQDEHTLRLERIETKLDEHDSKFDALEAKVDKLEAKVDALPRVLAEMLDERDQRKRSG